VTDPLKHQTNGRGLGFVDGIARDAAALMFTDIAVAIGRPGQNTDPTFMRGMAFTAPTAFQDLGTLVFGHHTLHLKQQVVFRRQADRPVEKHDLDPEAPKLINQ